LDKHEQEINQILGDNKRFRITSREVQIVIKEVSDIQPSDLHDHFIFKLIRHKVLASTMFWVFETTL
jgi:hypothetical protein